MTSRFPSRREKNQAKIIPHCEAFFRQYELIYIIGDERDLIGVRTNYRAGEDVYLYHTLASPAQNRARFLEYLNVLNVLRTPPTLV